MKKLSFDEVKEQIINAFISNKHKQMDGMIYFDNSEKSYCWSTDKRSIVLTMRYDNITDIQYFKMNKSKGFKTE